LARIAYDPKSLTGLPIQQIKLDSVSALRIDDLPVGPAGITTQIVAIRNNRIYEVLVEPQDSALSALAPNKRILRKCLAG